MRSNIIQKNIIKIKLIVCKNALIAKLKLQTSNRNFTISVDRKKRFKNIYLKRRMKERAKERKCVGIYVTPG